MFTYTVIIGAILRSIVIDLDDTICFPNHEYTDTVKKYVEAKPNLDVIVKIQELHNKGYDIIIHSARRMLTHNGDITKIEADILDITEIWLENNDVPYSQLIFGKPYSHTYYVDDKAMSVSEFVQKEFTND